MSELRRILVVTGDHHRPDPTKWDGAYTEEDLQLHRAMVAALESLGRWEVEVCADHSALVPRLLTDPPSLVVNFCDTGFRNEASRELHVPALLELLGIPYTGSPPTAMVLAYDKPLVGLIARSMDIAVPFECRVEPGTEPRSLDVAFPAFVKPATGDGSVGINRRALVRDRAELIEQLAWFHRTLPDRVALVQEYLPGPEYGLALLGNPGDLRALPPLEIDYSALPTDLPPILAFESKTGPSTPYEDVGIRPATLSPDVVDELRGRASALFERLGCRDYARFDFRTAADGAIKLMEVNPNPAWSREAKLAQMARFDGMDYPQLLERLVEIAWARATP